jgi:flavin-dependent dehydrogenase
MSIDYHRNIPLNGKYDVIVCGGGPSGIPAALAARRSGLTVLLVESAGQLGGTGTSAGVLRITSTNVWAGYLQR